MSDTTEQEKNMTLLQVGTKVVLQDGNWARITTVDGVRVHLDGWYTKDGSFSTAAGTPPIFLARNFVQEGLWTLVSGESAQQIGSDAQNSHRPVQSSLRPAKRTLTASQLAEILYFEDASQRDKAYEIVTKTKEYELRLSHYERRHRDQPAMYVDWLVIAPPRVLDDCGFYELMERSGCRPRESDTVKYIVVDNDSSDID